MKKIIVLFALACISLVYCQNVMTEGPDKGDWVIGGNLGFGGGNNGGFSLIVAPEIGYRLHNGLEFGVNVGYNLYTQSEYKSTFINAGPYLQYTLLQNFFAKAMYQYLSGSTKYDNFNGQSDFKQTYDESALWLGAGYQNRIGNNVYYRLGVMYNVLYDENDSVFYGSSFMPIGGISFSF